MGGLMTRRKVKVKRQPSGLPRGRGRPSEYSDEIADTICQRIADGESLRSICQDKAMPDRRSVFRWLARKREFRHQYEAAVHARAELLADEIILIADSTGKDVMRDRLRVDSRKWVLSKLLPRKYGETATLLAPAVDEDGEVVGPRVVISYEKPEPAK